MREPIVALERNFQHPKNSFVSVSLSGSDKVWITIMCPWSYTTYCGNLILYSCPKILGRWLVHISGILSLWLLLNVWDTQTLMAIIKCVVSAALLITCTVIFFILSYPSPVHPFLLISFLLWHPLSSLLPLYLLICRLPRYHVWYLLIDIYQVLSYSVLNVKAKHHSALSKVKAIWHLWPSH